MDAIRAITPTEPGHIPDKLRSLASFWREIAAERRADGEAAEWPADAQAWLNEAREWERAADWMDHSAARIEGAQEEAAP